jgi:hypothetical protein
MLDPMAIVYRLLHLEVQDPNLFLANGNVDQPAHANPSLPKLTEALPSMNLGYEMTC